ncbi:hypothetical protein, partial [Pseudomonas aeruginosa]|uniref:hypothetical protein n=2 Tax=Gammaproteobacteria TaxID=1236 RepID=UPI001ABCDD7C
MRKPQKCSQEGQPSREPAAHSIAELQPDMGSAVASFQAAFLESAAGAVSQRQRLFHHGHPHLVRRLALLGGSRRLTPAVQVVGPAWRDAPARRGDPPACSIETGGAAPLEQRHL